MKPRMILILSAVLLSAAGCGQKPPPAAAPSGALEAELDAALLRAAEASAEIAAIEIAAAGGSARDPVPEEGIPPELRKRVSVDWNGPAEPLLRAVAERIGWKFTVSGPRSQPLMISMSRRGEEAWKILRDAGTAAGSEALVIADAGARTIEMRRPAVDR